MGQPLNLCTVESPFPKEAFCQFG